jgi:RNA-directed DNA polymerase
METKENMEQSNSYRTQSRENGPNRLSRVRETAKKDRKVRFTALLHHVTIERLRASYLNLKRQAAPGVDGMRWEEYGVNLEARLHDLHGRVHRGVYRAQPSRRVMIPKTDGRQRPLGVAALEDKILQHAVGIVLNHIWDEDFLGFSYGFRPGRSQHDALDALYVGITRKKVSWVLDLDIRAFFDTIDHAWMVRFVEHRIGDRRIVRLIQKWLKAGVLEQGRWSETEQGVPQGATISPILANLYLHHVLDLWANQWRQKKARGEVMIVRYADDAVLGFQHRTDAERFLAECRERLAKFGLELHAEKTRLIEFGVYASERRKERGLGKPDTFDFLGFTHFCRRSQKTGYFEIRRKTIGKRMTAKLKEIAAKLRQRMHEPIGDTLKWLQSVVRGYFQYHAIPGNWQRLTEFRKNVLWLWHRTLRRRSNRTRWTWNRFRTFLVDQIPEVRILHPYPNVRFAAKHPR